VSAVAIRQLSGGEAVLAGGRSRAEGPPKSARTRWVHAPNGAGLAEQLSRAGLL